MTLKGVLSFIFILFVVFSFIFYWFVPFNTTEFFDYSSDNNFNFSLENSNLVNDSGMQFYSNMRYQYPEISYKIHECPLYKQNNINDAFEAISNLTVLSFNEVSSGEEISAFCSERSNKEANSRGYYVAGEGGPVNITKTDNFNVIFKGEITLIKESSCDKPNIVIHEIFHALGFDHSGNSKSIMYDVSKCNQEIGEDLINAINEIYSYPVLPDLAFEDVSALMHGRYLDTNVSIRNNGLKTSQGGTLLVYADEKNIKEFDLDSIETGYGTEIMLKNLLVPQMSVDEIKFVIEYNYDELEKSNNEIKLKIKK
jgi:hypothetical protein|tara:strand:+ start:441 stop:1376 length:936 start_codon:yes stop_codon:yes gene_type:complete